MTDTLAPLPSSRVSVIDRQLEDAVADAIQNNMNPDALKRISELGAERVRLTEPAAFGEIERILETFGK